MNISPVIQQVTYPPITEVKQWIAGRNFSSEKPLIDLCQAIPDYPPAAELVDYLKQQLDDSTLAVYSADEGLADVRQSVAQWYDRHYSSDSHDFCIPHVSNLINAEQVCLTIGASQAFWLAMMTLCQTGDEVIVQLPAYFDHPMGIQSMGIKPVYLPFDSASGLPDAQMIEASITPRTKAILLVTPSNPTGKVLPNELTEEIYQLAVKHNITLVLDETYNAFLAAGSAPHQLFSQADWVQNFVHIASFGKTFALTGFRAGALVAGEEFIYHALKLQDSMVVCQPRITQRAIAFGCDNLDGWVADNALMMKQRHDDFCCLFTTPKNKFKLCTSGAFFAWVKHPWSQLSSKQAARKLADESNVICLPGEVFGPGLDCYLRLAFGNVPQHQIANAVKRFTDW